MTIVVSAREFTADSIFQMRQIPAREQSRFGKEFSAFWLAGAPGFEPGNGGIKIRCLTTWLRPKALRALLAPASAAGDRHGTPFREGVVTTPPGWRQAYRDWAAGGWNALAAPAQWGGQDLPQAINAACLEMWNSACMAFGIGPVLTMAGVDALAHHGSDALKQIYLPKLVSGEWMGTMQLT